MRAALERSRLGFLLIRLVARFWRRHQGLWQWYVLWLTQPKFIVGVTGVILNERGEVLLLRHRFWREGSWGLPSGYMIPRERLEETLAREVREETGYRIGPPVLLRFYTGYRLRMEACFMARLAGGDLTLDPREVLEARFFAPDALPEGLLRSHRYLVGVALAEGALDTLPSLPAQA